MFKIFIKHPAIREKIVQLGHKGHFDTQLICQVKIKDLVQIEFLLKNKQWRYITYWSISELNNLEI